MPMRAILFALLFLLPLTTPLWADNPKDGLLIKRPAGIDDATWERIKAAHAARIQEFVDILAKAEKDRPRPDRDTIGSYLEKRDKLHTLIADQAQGTLAALTRSDTLMLNNYVFIWSEVSPRLSGAIRKVGRGDNGPSLAETLAEAKPGDLVLLEEGEYQFGNCPNWEDIAVAGRGASKTTLKLNRRGGLQSGQRVRFEGLKIDCGDDNWCDLRDGALHMRDCHVFNYNSGAGGSNSMFAVNSILLIEGCTFEGLTGRAGEGGDRGGVAFDFRGFNVLYARRTEFVNNAEILRASFPCTFDECSSKEKLTHAHGIMGYGGPIWLRQNSARIHDQRDTDKFEFAADERAFVEFVLGERRELDARSKRLAEECALARHLPYWIRLLGHRDTTVRNRASAQFEALTGQKVERPKEAPKVGAEEIARLIKDLDSNSFRTREQAKAGLEKAGEAAREALDAIVAKGSLEQNRRAQEVLARLDAALDRHLQARDLEFCHWNKWYDKHRDRLHWEDRAKRYVIKDE